MFCSPKFYGNPHSTCHVSVKQDISLRCLDFASSLQQIDVANLQSYQIGRLNGKYYSVKFTVYIDL